MKKIALLLPVLIVLFSVQLSFAQKEGWKEMKDFHAVMSKTFHPAEEGNLTPVRENAATLVTLSQQWAAAAIPEGFDKNMTANTLKLLVVKCQELQNHVAEKATDAVLTTTITEAHEIFHQVAEKCRKGEDHDGHEHHKE